MPLTTVARKSLVERLVEVHTSVDELATFLDLEVGRQLSLIVAEGNLRVRAHTVVRASEAEGWLRSLVEALHAHAPHSTSRAILEELTTVSAATSHGPRWESCFPRKRAFVNRKGFRMHVAALVQADDERVLAVAGPRFSGKSYSRYLIFHVVDGYDSVDIAFFDFARYEDPTRLGPVDIIRGLCGHMGVDGRELDRVLDDYAQGSRQVSSLCAWLLGEVRKRPKCTWLVFDSLDLLRPSEDVLDLLRRFTELAEQERKLCVLLLGYDERLQIVDELGTLHDRLDDIRTSDVERFLLDVAEENGLQLEATTIEGLVQAIVDELPEDVEKRGLELTKRITRVTRTLPRGDAQ